MPNPVIKFATGKLSLDSCPIRPAWILEGDPVARNTMIAGSADGAASTLMWDCTAGRFNWHYEIDETICVVEGSVTVRDQFGDARTLVAGDTAFFPAGSSAEWTVDNYVRKIAFMRRPLPRAVLMAKRAYKRLRRLVGTRTGSREAPALFPSI
jgi:uncharacterized cupin superfamily protein